MKWQVCFNKTANFCTFYDSLLFKITYLLKKITRLPVGNTKRLFGVLSEIHISIIQVCILDFGFWFFNESRGFLDLQYLLLEIYWVKHHQIQGHRLNKTVKIFTILVTAPTRIQEEKTAFLGGYFSYRAIQGHPSPNVTAQLFKVRSCPT